MEDIKQTVQAWPTPVGKALSDEIHRIREMLKDRAATGDDCETLQLVLDKLDAEYVRWLDELVPENEYNEIEEDTPYGSSVPRRFTWFEFAMTFVIGMLIGTIICGLFLFVKH